MHRAAFILVLLVTTCAARGAFSGVVFFGDSLTDVGNVYNQTFGLAPQSPPYYQGRYSNGPLWAERLALDLSLPNPTPSRLGGRDYAYAGTKTGSGSTFIFPFAFPNIGTQINSYLGGNTPSPDQLFVIWGGGNDFINGQTNPSVPVTNIANHVTTLANHGAKKFLVPNLPPLGKVPRFRGTPSEATMDLRSLQFNAQLASTLSNLELSLNVQIWNLDVGGLFFDLLNNPAAYGFTNVTQPALVGGTPVPNQDEYLFWDDIHPTRVGHRILGQIAAEAVVTHRWVSTQASGNWSDPLNWDPPAAPAGDWIAEVINSNIGSAQAVLVTQPSNVARVRVRGNTGPMRLLVGSGAMLSAGSLSIGPSCALVLSGGAVSAPTIEVGVGGILEGTGTVLGMLRNAGMVDPAPAVAVDAEFIQQPTGKLRIDLGGTGIGAFDRLEVEGLAELAGSIQIGLIGGFIPLPGQSFEVLTFASRSGDIAIINHTGFAGLAFQKSYGDSSLLLTATARGGDANLDGVVNLADFNVLAANFGGGGLTWLDADFTADGLVNLADFNILAGNFGQTAPGPQVAPEDWASLATAVPEPASFAAAAPLALLFASRRMRRRSSDVSPARVKRRGIHACRPFHAR